MEDDKKNVTSSNGDANPVESVVEPSGTIRPEMVDAARQFMVMPKVRQTSFEQQRRFLLAKGLRENEIDEAKKLLPPPPPAPPSYMQRNGMATQQHMINPSSSIGWPVEPTKSTPSGGFIQMIKYTMLVTGFTYAGWRLMRSVILPRFFSVPEPADERLRVLEAKLEEMQTSMQSVMDALRTTVKAINDQQVIMNQIVQQSNFTGQFDELKQSLQNISALLVNQQQFPPPRTGLLSSFGSGKIISPTNNCVSHDGTNQSCNSSTDNVAIDHAEMRQQETSNALDPSSEFGNTPIA